MVGNLGLGTRDASGGFQLADSSSFGLVGSEFFQVEDFGVGTRADSAGFQLADLAPLEEMASLIVDTT